MIIEPNLLDWYLSGWTLHVTIASRYLKASSQYCAQLRDVVPRGAATQCREDRAELYPRGNGAAQHGAAPDAMRTMFTN